MGCFGKVIGIVGGAGPMASAFLYTSILEVCQREYNANDYNEFPEIVLISYPFIRGDAEKVRKKIHVCVGKLKAVGVQLFCIASNSFHGFLPEMPKEGFVNLVEEGLKEAIRQNISKALILAAPLTIKLKLYETTKIACLYPNAEEEEQINQAIREVAGGIVEESRGVGLKKIIERIYAREKFDGIIIACTELPLLHKKIPFSDALPVIDTVGVLAKSLVTLALS